MNILARHDRRAEDRSVIPDRDEAYSYDRLNRLAEAERGSYDRDTPDWIEGKRGQKWSLDALGNWVGNDIDLDGSGTYGTDDDFIDARSHNAANEIAGNPARELYDPRVGMDEDPAEELEFQYDKAGNLIAQWRLVPDGEEWAVVEWQYVYDAWNRLVEVKIDPDAGGEDPAQVRARYGYNGLHWRVWRIADEDLDASSLPDVANLYYYDAMWRLLEERVRGDFGSSEDEWSEVRPDSGDLMKLTQRFWCLHYIDDLLAWQTREGYDPGGGGWVEPRTSVYAGLRCALDSRSSAVATQRRGSRHREEVTLAWPLPSKRWERKGKIPSPCPLPCGEGSRRHLTSPLP